MRLMNSELVRRAQVFLRETHFVVTGVPSLGNLQQAGGILSGLAEMRQNSESLKAGLVTGCSVARSVCKPVDDLVGRHPVNSRGYVSSGYGPARPVWTPINAAPTWIDMDDKAAMIRAMGG